MQKKEDNSESSQLFPATPLTSILEKTSKDELILALTKTIDSRLDQFRNDLTDLTQDHKAIDDLKQQIHNKDERKAEITNFKSSFHQKPTVFTQKF